MFQSVGGLNRLGWRGGSSLRMRVVEADIGLTSQHEVSCPSPGQDAPGDAGAAIGGFWPESADPAAAHVL